MAFRCIGRKKLNQSPAHAEEENIRDFKISAWPLLIYMEIPSKEDRHTEFKEDWKDQDCLKELCAFANTEGGSLYIGVKDDGEIVGVKNPNKAQKWEKSLPQKINKDLGFYPEKAEAISEDGKTIFHIEVKNSDYWIKYNGVDYERQGEHSRPLTGQALEAAKKRKMPKPWDEFTLGKVDISDLKIDLLREKIKKHCSKYKNNNHLLQVADRKGLLNNDKELLEELNLISQNKIKRAAALLFHPKPDDIIPFSCIRIIRLLPQDNEDNPSLHEDEIFLTKNLFSNMDKALKILSEKFVSGQDSFAIKTKESSKEKSRNLTEKRIQLDNFQSESGRNKEQVTHSNTRRILKKNLRLLKKDKKNNQNEQQTQNLLSKDQEDLKKDFTKSLYTALALKDYSIPKEIEVKIYESQFIINIPFKSNQLLKPLSSKPEEQKEIEIIRKKVEECLNETPNLCRIFKKIGFDVENFIQERLFSSEQRDGWELKLSLGGKWTGFQILFDKWKIQKLRKNKLKKQSWYKKSFISSAMLLSGVLLLASYSCLYIERSQPPKTPIDDEERGKEKDNFLSKFRNLLINITAKDNDVRTSLLHLAAKRGHTETVKELVEIGADITAKDNDGMTALHFAAMGGHTPTVKELVKLGADITAKDNDVRTSPLHLAAKRGHTETVKELVDRGADITAKDNDGMTALHYAAKHGHTETVKKLIKLGVNIKDKEGMTALHHAAEGRHTKTVKMLVDLGAETD